MHRDGPEPYNKKQAATHVVRRPAQALRGENLELKQATATPFPHPVRWTYNRSGSQKPRIGPIRPEGLIQRQSIEGLAVGL